MKTAKAKKNKAQKKRTIVLALQRFYKEQHRIPTRSDLEENNQLPKLDVIIKYFCDYYHALKAAKLNSKIGIALIGAIKSSNNT